MKIQVEEEKRVEEVLIEKLSVKEKYYEKFGVEIVASRKQLEKENQQLQLKFNKCIETLDQILEGHKVLHKKIVVSFDDKKKMEIEQSKNSTKKSPKVTDSRSLKLERTSIRNGSMTQNDEFVQVQNKRRKFG